jgi:hypothetical protein
MDSMMLTVSVEVEVFFDERTKSAQRAEIQTMGIPKEAHGWVKAAALDQFDRLFS